METATEFRWTRLRVYDCQTTPRSATERRRVVPKRSESPVRRDWTCRSADNRGYTVTSHDQSWLGISKTAWRRSTTVVERRWRQPVACSRNSTARPICAALDGDSRRCQYAYLQLSTIDDARPRSMTDRYFTGARRRKFWTFQNFRTATAAIGAQWRSAAFTHGCVCALWRSTAFIHGFWTAAERRQKPPMCNSGFTACTTDIVLMSEGGCKYSRCKRGPVIRSTACNQPTYLSRSNHVRFFNITFSFVILHTNNT